MAQASREIFRYTFYPVFVICSYLGHLELLTLFPGIHPFFLASPILLVGVLVALVLERVLPYRFDWNISDRDLISDFVLTNLFFPPVVLGIQFALKKLCGETGVWSVWPTPIPVLIQVVLALVISELCFYWTHRFGHEFSVLWHFHRVHHSSRRVYWMNSARFHPVDLFLNFFFYFLPLALLGAPSEVFALLFTINGATGLLEHANVDFEAGLLNRVFNTAQLHRFHHSVNVSISKKNYGKVLSIWDQVFGTFHFPQGEDVGKVGIEE